MELLVRDVAKQNRCGKRSNRENFHRQPPCALLQRTIMHLCQRPPIFIRVFCLCIISFTIENPLPDGLDGDEGKYTGFHLSQCFKANHLGTVQHAPLGG